MRGLRLYRARGEKFREDPGCAGDRHLSGAQFVTLKIETDEGVKDLSRRAAAPESS
jgi:hypothetical protein